MRRKIPLPIVGILVFGISLALLELLLSLKILPGLLIALGLSCCVTALTAASRSKTAKEDKPSEGREAENAPAEAHAPATKETRYSPEVNAIVDDGKLAMKEMGRLYASIGNPAIRSKINELMAISDKIVRDAIEDPSDVAQIRKFLDFYLPTTIRLLNTYDRMCAQDIEGENITGSKQRIEDMLDTAIDAYKKQLDALFANQAADIQTDIDTLNGMLAQEGLGGKGYLDLKEFMKDYEKKQKGSTSHG